MAIGVEINRENLLKYKEIGAELLLCEIENLTIQGNTIDTLECIATVRSKWLQRLEVLRVTRPLSTSQDRRPIEVQRESNRNENTHRYINAPPSEKILSLRANLGPITEIGRRPKSGGFSPVSTTAKRLLYSLKNT